INHKVACDLIKKAQKELDTQERELRAHPGDFATPANPFETAVGHFWGILDTRPYKLVPPFSLPLTTSWICFASAAAIIWESAILPLRCSYGWVRIKNATIFSSGGPQPQMKITMTGGIWI
ncbi:hypothetical protein DH86_00000423, partial [Scytalidium sp. 3C]